MTSQPPALQYQAGGYIPVLRGLWRSFGELNACQGILQQVRAFCPNAQMDDGDSQFGSMGLVFETPIFRTWFITGSFTVGTGTSQRNFTIAQFAGDLVDRLTKPDGWVDYDGDRSQPGAVGGGVLKYRDIGDDNVQLYWGK